MAQAIDMLGFEDNYFKVIEFSHSEKGKWQTKRYWKTLCKSCNKIILMATGRLNEGKNRSCGCLPRKGPNKGQKQPESFNHYKTHGLCKHPIYRLWTRIKERCHSIKDKFTSAKYYRKKGIKMCDEWRNDFKVFYVWAINNGWFQGCSIDRIDSNGNYEPSNCQFLTRSDNSKKVFLDNAGFCIGSNNIIAKLDEDKVREIKLLLSQGYTGVSIARKYGVTKTTISYIKKNKTWKHVSVLHPEQQPQQPQMNPEMQPPPQGAPNAAL